MRILQVTPRNILRPTTGAELRDYHLALELSRTMSVSYLGFSAQHSATTSTEVAGVPVTVVPQGRSYTPAKLLRGAFGRVPVNVLNRQSRAMESALARQLTASEFDVIQIGGVHIAPYLGLIQRLGGRGRILVCDWHNIESELMLRYSARAPSAIRRLYARRAASQLAAMEKALLGAVDLNLAVSERDRRSLLAIDPRAQVFVVENGVATRDFSDDELDLAYRTMFRCAPPQGRQRVLFVGSMDYHANIDAALYFVRNCWPAIHASSPELRFTIVGRNPPLEVQALASVPGVEVTGSVADVRPYYREGLVAVVPLRVGSGTRLKILEAMAAGVPVVSTRLGAEGLAARSGADLMIVETPEQIWNATLKIASNHLLFNDFRAAGRALVRSRYDWATIGENLRELYASCATGGTDGRCVPSVSG